MTDRYTEFAAAMQRILRNLAIDPETASANLGTIGSIAAGRLYQEFPDITIAELDQISQAYGLTVH